MNTSCVPSLPHSLHPHSPHSSLTIPSLCVQKHCIGTLPWFRSESDVSKHAWPPSDLHGNSGTERGNGEVEGAKGGTEIIDLHRLAYPPNWNFALDEDESAWDMIPDLRFRGSNEWLSWSGPGPRGEGRGLWVSLPGRRAERHTGRAELGERRENKLKQDGRLRRSETSPVPIVQLMEKETGAYGGTWNERFRKVHKSKNKQTCVLASLCVLLCVCYWLGGYVL